MSAVTEPTQGRAEAEVLRLIDEATAASTGQQFFDALVRNVAGALGTRCTFITRFSADLRLAHVRAFWLGDKLLDLFTYELRGTPCEVVLPGDVVCIERDVADRFPDHRHELEEIGAQSYLAIPLRAMDGQVIGHLAVIDSVERVWQETEIGILRIFAARATAELQREEFEDALKLANEEMRRMKESAEAASRAKSDFLATMSHELRTPLNGILGYSQILQRDSSLDTRQRRSVDSIERCAEHLLALIGDILDLAKIEAGKLELHPQVLDVQEFLDSVVEMGRMDALRSGLRFAYEVRSRLPSHAEVDERRLRQILLNLLSNAVKYTDAGAVTFRAEHHQESDGSTFLCFEVEDTGIGIAPGEVERIFDRFEQGTERHPSRTQSTGLGLTISRHLARTMGGDISVQSTPGKGSRFRVSVRIQETAAAARQPLPTAGNITAYTGPRRRVLVVDDQPDNRDVLRHLLTSLGFAVDEAADGPGAIEAAAHRVPDMVLMDLVMPGMSGGEALVKLRAAANRDIPAIAVSASALERTREESAAAGFQAFLPKPLRFDSLLEVMGKVLGLTWVIQQEARPDRAPVRTNGGEAGLRQEVVSALYELARRGDIRAIESRLEELARVAGPDDELLARLRALTERYDMKGIRALLAPGGV